MAYKSGYKTRSKLEAFEDNFIPEPNSGCWLWFGAQLQRGDYGVFTHRPSNTKGEYAHRAAWEFYVGPIPEDAHVLHKCDIPLCVNPDHLFLGDQSSNMKDMKQKGRQAKGEKHGSYKHGKFVDYR